MHRRARCAIHIGVSHAWIEIVTADGVRHRHVLSGGLTVVGGKRADVDVANTDGDQLHVWDKPPKMVFLGAGPPPRVNGASCEERELRPGDLIEWRGVRIEFGGLPYAAIEEIPLAPPSPPKPSTLAAATSAERTPAPEDADAPAWRRIKAGLIVELGLADSSTARRWQEAIQRSEFEADSCARDLLAASSIAAGDARVAERCTRLQRDLIMAPVQLGLRGSSRKLKSTANNWLAMAIAQFVVFGICCLLVLVTLFVLRVRWDWSADAFFDSISNALSGS